MNEEKYIQITYTHNYSLWEQTQHLPSFWESQFNSVELLCFKHFLCTSQWAKIMSDTQRWTRLGALSVPTGVDTDFELLLKLGLMAAQPGVLL